MKEKWLPGDLKQRSQRFLAPGTNFVKDDFSMNQGREEIQYISYLLHFISIVIMWAPLQIIRQYILEVGGPGPKKIKNCVLVFIKQMVDYLVCFNIHWVN